jgi:hypothetical protein
MNCNWVEGNGSTTDANIIHGNGHISAFFALGFGALIIAVAKRGVCRVRRPLPRQLQKTLPHWQLRTIPFTTRHFCRLDILCSCYFIAGL